MGEKYEWHRKIRVSNAKCRFGFYTVTLKKVKKKLEKDLTLRQSRFKQVRVSGTWHY